MPTLFSRYYTPLYYEYESSHTHWPKGSISELFPYSEDLLPDKDLNYRVSFPPTKSRCPGLSVTRQSHDSSGDLPGCTAASMLLPHFPLFHEYSPLGCRIAHHCAIPTAKNQKQHRHSEYRFFAKLFDTAPKPKSLQIHTSTPFPSGSLCFQYSINSQTCQERLAPRNAIQNLQTIHKLP